MDKLEVHYNKGYTAMSNYHLRDVSLSWQAMGLLSFMLSCREDFKFSVEGLKMCSSCGETATRSALRELKENGYVVVSRLVGCDGKVVGWKYDVYENPNHSIPDVENPDVEKQTQRNTNIRPPYTLFNNKDISPHGGESAPVDDGFDAAWKAYGRKGNKMAAHRYWKKLSAKDRKAIMDTIPLYLAAMPDEKYRKDFSGWINPTYRRWEDKIVNNNQVQIKKENNNVWTV